ncbi:MAG: D-tyrosyl-tRNA(Tyr) deacylase [Bacteroidia bacterium]|nr:D-tyrosyl-tRNA(Tyr) deacylase [Bacteroidia bacterium]
MRAVIQRVSRASVRVENNTTASIEKGIVVLLGIEAEDSGEDVEWLCQKISGIRIFPDDSGVMNLSLPESGGRVIVVSQFTLHASTRKGKRPSYIRAARPEQAIPLYEAFIQRLDSLLGQKTGSGIFGAHMMVELVNDGPVTLIIDSKWRE